MSGGSHNYAYSKVEDMAGQLSTSDDPLRVAFANHLRLVAKAMHDVEWVDSYDSAKGTDAAAIRTVLGESAQHAELSIILEQAEKVAGRFEAAIDKVSPRFSGAVGQEVMALRETAHAAMNKLDAANERGDIATRLARVYSEILSILGAPGEGSDIEDLNEWAREYGAKLEALTRELDLWQTRTAALVWKLQPETTAGEVQKWEADYQTGLARAEAQKDAAYLERNRLVAALAKCFPSRVAKTAIEGWDPAWHNCVYIDLPTGQASWHYHDREEFLFADIPHVDSWEWDGHSTEEKYRRVEALPNPFRVGREPPVKL